MSNDLRFWNLQEAIEILQMKPYGNITITETKVVSALRELEIPFRQDQGWRMYETDFGRLNDYFNASNKRHRSCS